MKCYSQHIWKCLNWKCCFNIFFIKCHKVQRDVLMQCIANTTYIPIELKNTNAKAKSIVQIEWQINNLLASYSSCIWFLFHLKLTKSSQTKSAQNRKDKKCEVKTAEKEIKHKCGKVRILFVSFAVFTSVSRFIVHLFYWYLVQHLNIKNKRDCRMLESK